MQTVSKTYGAADTEAQAPASGPEKAPIGRAKVALICLTAALVIASSPPDSPPRICEILRGSPR